MDINQVIRDIVREEIAGLTSAVSSEPELITISTFIKNYGVNRAVVESLHRGRVANGFPSVGKKLVCTLPMMTITPEGPKTNALFSVCKRLHRSIGLRYPVPLDYCKLTP